MPGHEAEVAGDRGQDDRLEHDLGDDRRRRRAERAPDADLLRALLDDDEHDVGDADDAGGQRADADDPDQDADAGEEPVDLAELLLAG